MFKHIWLALVCMVIAGCGSSPVQLTSTANAIRTQTEMAVPTSTYTPSLTVTPSPTPTVTPSPTPLGGGNGMLIFAASSLYGQPASEADGIYTINSDGSGLKQVLSRSQIESIIGGKYTGASYISYSNQGYIFSNKGLYAITDNWQFESKAELKNTNGYGFIGFSPDGKQIMYHGTDRYIYISSIDGLDTHKLIGGRDIFSGWSADGSMVYFWKNGGRSMGAINADGSNYHELSLTALENYTPYEGLPLPSGLNSYYRRFDAYAVSPDKKQVAFTWLDLLFVADATDLEFSNPRLILRLHGSDAESESYGFPIIWSPDNNSILIELNRFNNSIMSWETDKLILANVTEGKTETVSTSFQFGYALCGFSPDGNQILYEYDDSTAEKSIVQFEKLGDSSPTTLIDYTGSVNCPIWQFSGGQ